MDKPYPASRDVERAVIGAMINFPEETIGMVVRSGGGDLFSANPYTVIYRALDYLHDHGEPVEYLTLLDRLEKDNALDAAGGEDTILAVMSEAFTAANIGKHVEMLRDKALLRKLITVTGAVNDRCFDHAADPETILDFLRGRIHELREFEDRKGGTLTDQIREWILATQGTFLTTDIHRELQLTTVSDKKTSTKILGRLVEEGLIERYGNRRGSYRRIEGDCEKIYWKNAGTNILDFRWPGGIERYVEIMPGNVIVIAGEPNAGKTAFLLNVVRMNMAQHDIHYLTSEMGAAELHKRLANFDDIGPDDWRFTPWERSADFADVVRPDAVNIIDYMDIHEDFYRLGGCIKAVYDRLRHGIAVIAIQKNTNTDIGRGGIATLEKPRLYLSMKPHRLTIVKGKNWASHENPNGLSSAFKLVKGARFAFDSWGRGE